MYIRLSLNSVMNKKKKNLEKLCKQLEEWQKDPEFLREVRELVERG